MKTFRLKFLLKSAISILLLFYVLRTIDFKTLLITLRNTETLFWGLALVLFPINLALMTLTWRLFLSQYEEVDFLKLLKIYWQSDFVNLAGAGGLAGEVYKVFSLEKRKAAVFTSLLDRIYSLVWYSLFAFSIYLSLYWFSSGIVGWIGGIGLFILLSFTLIIINRYLIKFFDRKLSQFFKWEVLEHLYFPSSLLFKHGLAGIAYIQLSIVIYSLVFRSLGIEIPLTILAWFVPVVIIAVTLPVSYQGLGLREWLFVGLAQMMQFPEESALAASLLIFGLGIIYRLCGFFVFLKPGK